MSDTPRVVIGAGPEERIPALVTEWTVRKHTPQVEVIHTFDRELPTAKRQGTAFSFVRFWVPELCGRKGRAIYLDSDMLCFCDLRELWALGEEMLSESCHVLRTSDPSVLLIDCERVNWNAWAITELVDQDPRAYGPIFSNLAGVPAARISDQWNRHDRWFEEGTKILHYTNLRRQPWKFPDHPFGWMWYRELAEASNAGFLDSLPGAETGLWDDVLGEPIWSLMNTEAYKRREELGS